MIADPHAAASNGRELRRGHATVRRHLAATIGLFAVALVVLGLEAAWAPFEADEADYVATSRYFGYLFLQRDVARKEWDSNHWTRTQPPLTRYIVGVWLTAYGHDLETMNQPYVSTASSFEVNRQKGRVPTDDVLARARQPMVLLGAGAIALLYPLSLLLGGPTVGLIVAALALSSPFMRYTLVHAWAEAPLAFFLVLSALLAAYGVRRVLSGGRVVFWALALGGALGLASATKLTGLVGVALTLGCGAVMALWLWRQGGNRRAAVRIAAWAAGAAAVALLLFVALNPYLWRGPVSGLQGMLEERRDEMAFQQDQWPEYAVTGWLERPWLTVSGSLQVGPLAETQLAALVNLPLLVIGLAGLAARVRRDGLASPAGMLVGWLLGFFVVVVLGLGLKYPRYFMPTTLLFLPVVALGLVPAVEAIWRRVPRALGRPQPAA
jgi:4-amino-4-deoxy-L-arabinose transferase-like glycosyltransferase